MERERERERKRERERQRQTELGVINLQFTLNFPKPLTKKIAPNCYLP